ncbi:RidA family protein [Deinococcus aquaedulcis]|uniref:RidA family protein n=1 Tax=Deinococcus aquaedulcis TaxID=2840455 RepID=UPI001C82DC14|nr:RidA family protein [Deinococcus aquaedulcis]
MSETIFHSPDTLPQAPGYTPAVEVRGGRTLYISGQVALNAGGELVGPGDFEAQARQCFQNVAHALAAADMTFADVVKLGLYVLDMAGLPTLRRVRDDFVNTAQPPASTLVQVSAFFRPDVLVEVEAVAVAPLERRA